jgi:Fic family protein
MKPPYNISNEIIKLVSEVSQKIGEVNASFLTKQSPELRKSNRIKTIQASLAVEGNSLSVDQVTSIIENKRVLGPAKDIKEVSNAIKVYEQLDKLNPFSEKSFLFAHKILMQGLIKNAGKYRTSGVGIIKGSKVTHLEPAASNISFLMKDLFKYAKSSNELLLIKSCVFHYELEFIHPFSDGNGRMGRLWQTLLLMQQFPVFGFLPFETLISKNQNKYYQALSASDKKGESSSFIEFMLTILSSSLDELLKERPGPLTSLERVKLFIESGIKEFTRKHYMTYFKTISSSTASRDLLLAVNNNILKKLGDKNKTIYRTKGITSKKRNN